MLDWSVGVPDVGAATHPSRGTTPQNGAAWKKQVGTVNFSNAETEELRELGGIRIARLRPLGNKRPGVAEFIGFVGRQAVPFEAHLTPAAEVGWRLARAHWHHGYATEAARQEVTFGSERAGIPEIVSFTNEANVRSQKVMQPLV
jgi:RimJ/RimL family protein N-acetyltransferase